jgi:hypothetical protein
MVIRSLLPLGVAIAAVLSATSPLRAQPAADARRLFEEGARRFEAGDYEVALARFRAAYQRAPRAKILLNIATTLARLGRSAEAADAYEQYLAASDRDPAKGAGVRAAIRDLDRGLGKIDLAVSSEGAQVVLDGAPIGTAPLARIVRVAAGNHIILVERGSARRRVPVELAAGQTRSVVVDDLPAPATAAAPAPPVEVSSGAPPPPARAERRLWAGLRADVDPVSPGVAAAPGLALRLGLVDVVAAALVGARKGGELGLRLRLGSARVRPYLLAAAPMFVDDGARLGVRGAAGAALSLGSRARVIADAGAAYFPSVPADVDHTALLLSLGLELGLTD